MRSSAGQAGLDAAPSPAALSKARVEYLRRHGGSRSRLGSSAAALRKADDLMNEAAGERSAAVRWVLLDEARKTGISAGSAFIVGRAVRLLGSEFDIDELDLEYRSLREIPVRALRGERGAELARSAETLATRAEVDGRPDVAIESLELAVTAWQASGADGAARAAAERHDRLLASARADLESSGESRPPRDRRGGDTQWRPRPAAGNGAGETGSR